MQLALFDQKSRLADRLGKWRSNPLNFTDSSRFPETRTEGSVALRTPVSTLEGCHLNFLLRYDVFPSSVLNFFGEWQRESRLMRAGDVIIQQANLPPVKWGLKLLFGVRVLSVEQTDTRVAFTYGTLEGHPEMGTNEFSFSLAGDQIVIGAFGADVGCDVPFCDEGAFYVFATGGCGCPGDLDADGSIGVADLAILLSQFGVSQGATEADGDSDADGDVDIADLAVLLGLFGGSCG